MTNQKTPEPTSGFQRALTLLLQLALGALITLTICGFLSQYHLVFELVSHFRVQYAAVSFLCVIPLIIIRRRRWVLAGIACFLVNASLVLPWYIDRDTGVNPSGKNLRIFLANVYTGNRQHGRLLEAVRVNNPDLVALLEVNDAWMVGLKPLEEIYPFHISIPREDNFGIAFFSRIPFDEKENIKYIGNNIIPSIQVILQLNGHPVNLMITHTFPPVTTAGYKFRNEQLADISSLLHNLKEPKILIGDLNLTMWSSYYAKFEKHSGMHNARKGFGIIPTWPASLPLLRLPLDHCLVSSDIKVIKCKSDPEIGSDHLPLLVELVLP